MTPLADFSDEIVTFTKRLDFDCPFCGGIVYGQFDGGGSGSLQHQDSDRRAWCPLPVEAWHPDWEEVFELIDRMNQNQTENSHE